MLGATASNPADFGTLPAAEFRKICELVRSRTGIELTEAKRQLCQTRLLRRLRALGLRSYREYVALLDDPHAAEHTELINAITTNVTSFYREEHHFELLGKLLRERATQTNRIRIWSAGCSSGEEPWSIAITVREALGTAAGIDVKILATDIDTQVVAHATAGVYTDEAVEPIGRARLQRYFKKGVGANAGSWRVGEELRSLVTFKQLNLFEPYPMRGPFDVIFCRNVIIYFDVENKAKLLRRYHDLLIPRGHLMLGHSESITAGVQGFALVGRTAYRKAD